MSFAKVRHWTKRIRNDDRGVAAIEFAIIGVLMIFVLVGGLDIGMAVLMRMQMNDAVSAAADAALINGAGVSGPTVDTTAKSIAAILTSASSDKNKFQLTFNGTRAYDFVGSTGTATGLSSAADECRCPTQVNGTITWGGKVDCGTSCPNGSLAGKYVSIRFSRSYTPLFSQFGFVKDGQMTVQTLAQVQ